MSNYTQNVSYGPKDALTQGDPNKAILGTQIDAELSEISTAIASKEDAANKGQPSGYAPLNASSLLVDSYLTTNIPRLDAASNLFTGTLLSLSSVDPTIRLVESDAAADNQRWLIEAQGEQLLFRLQNDAASVANNWITVDRTGTAIDSVRFGAAEWVFNRASNAQSTIKIGEASALRGDSADSAIIFYGEQTGAIGSVTITYTGTQLQYSTSNVSSVSYNMNCYVAAGNLLRIFNTANTGYVTFNHDGTNFLITGVNTTNIVVSGAALQPTTIELGHATDTTLSRVSAGVVAIEGANVVTETSGDARYKKQGRNTIPIMAAAMIPAATNGPAQATVTAATNLQTYKTLDFDQTTQEFAHFQIPFPKGWNEGTITFQPIWTAAAGTGGVVWELEAVAVGNDDAIDVAWGTAQNSIDTLIATGDIHVGPESSAITIAGTPAADDLVFFRIKRAPANASDTLTADARLIGIRIFYTDNAADDT